MRKTLFFLLLLAFLLEPVAALEIQAPEAPSDVRNLISDKPDSFGQGLLDLIKNGLLQSESDFSEAKSICVRLIVSVLIVSILQTISGPVKIVSDVAGTAALAVLLLQNTQTMIGLATETISKIGDYGKLLLPVMTSAMAAQGQISSSAALYTGSVFFISILSSFISSFFSPMVYLFVSLATASSATGENLLKRFSELLKGFMSWSLKTLLIIFTTYMSITGIVSGTTDAAVLKATKVTISTVVPVVGGILSDASESVLVSASLLKNAAGVYGILAMIALFLGPFIKIGSHYLILKLTAALCEIFGTKQMTNLISDYSTAMGLLLGMTGASCLMHLISTICFMKGVG